MVTDPVVREQALPAEGGRPPGRGTGTVPRWTHRDWRVPPTRGDTSPDAAQAARRRRAIHRIQHPRGVAGTLGDSAPLRSRVRLRRGPRI